MGRIESEQSREIKITQLDRGPFLLRYASYRKSEDAKLNLRSEDYLASDIEMDRAIFVLCDGVGSSFYGDIGSQILGETVLSWLQNIKFEDVLSSIHSKEGANRIKNIHKNLQEFLDSQVKFASAIVEKKDITTGKDSWTQLAEKNQRDQFGTQSNFVGGIIWPKSTICPDGIVLLFWLGNARVRIFSRERELTYLLRWGEDPDQLREVWSSREGVIGCVHSYVTDLSDIEYVIGYSDGLEEVENLIYPGISSDQFETIVNRAQSIKDDDISYFEISPSVSQVVGEGDDIASSVREYFRTLSLKSNGASIQEIEILKKQIRSLIRRIDENKLLLIKANQRTKIAVGVASLIFLCLGFFLSYLFNPNREIIVDRPVYITSEPVIIYKYWPTPTVTATSTPTPTLDVTSTPTVTETQTTTPTISTTPTNSATPSPTPTLTETPTPTPTETPTPTPTPTSTTALSLTQTVLSQVLSSPILVRTGLSTLNIINPNLLCQTRGQFQHLSSTSSTL